VENATGRLATKLTTSMKINRLRTDDLNCLLSVGGEVVMTASVFIPVALVRPMLIRHLMGVRGKQKRSERTRRSASLQTAGGEPFRNDLRLPREYGGGFAAGIRRVACRQTPLRRTRLTEAQLQRTKCRKPIISPDMVGMGRGGWEPKGICLAKAMGICHKVD